jgi:undecaprenyl-diphosphatase
MSRNTMLNAIQTFDTRTFLRCFAHVQHHSSASLTKSALIISATADGWYYCVLVPIIILAQPLAIAETLQLAVYAFGLERALYFILKNTFRRRRPQQALQDVRASIIPSDRFSLPSGHTSAAFLFVTFLCVAISPVFAPLYVWAVAVGMSRVVLGVHFPTDVVLGALLGSSIALAIV